MRVVFVILISFSFIQTNAQRVVKAYRENVINNFKEDIDFWRSYTSAYLTNYQYPIIQFKKSYDKTWSSEMVLNNIFWKQTYAFDTLAHFDEEGNIDKYLVRQYEKGLFNFFAFSKNPRLKNKIGMGYTVTDYDNKKTDFIYFVDYSCWDSLKDLRKHKFIQLIRSSIDISQADSILETTLKKEKAIINIIEVGSLFSDSSYNLPKLTDDLFVQYERDFAQILYSGKDSTYEQQYDRWGNYSIAKDRLEENIVEVVGVEGKPQKQNIVPSTLKIKAIDLLFDQQSLLKSKVYPGINKPVETSTGEFIGHSNTFLHDEVINKFGDVSKNLFQYLIEVYK